MNAVKMEKVSKIFGTFKANDKIDLNIQNQEIHAILGENGAGKSTLMNLLFGLYELDEGTIYIDEKKVIIKSPSDAQKLGIGMVHQHFKLVHNFSIVQNVILGDEPLKAGRLDLNSPQKKLNKLIKNYNFNLDVNEKIENLTIGQQQKVEILKVLYKDAKIIIFDEPTAVLTPQETEEFLKIIIKLQKEGKTIILITHKLNEIKKVADKCTIIRKGKVIDTIDVQGMDEAQMANMMVGKNIDLTINKKPVGNLGNILKVENVSYTNEKKIQKLKNINLEVKKGSILGIAGVDNNGQKELVEVLTGLIKPQSGEILYFKNSQSIDLTKKSIREINKKIISHIPEDRLEQGIVGEYNLAQNAVLIQYHEKQFSKNGILNNKNINSFGKKIIENYDVRSSRGIENKATELSGGNQQKLIIGRQIEVDADIIVAFQPTRGVDVGAIKFIHDKLIEQRDKGKAIILVSMELNEVMALSDEIAVIHDGKIIDTVNATGLTKEKVGLMMAGKKVENEN